MNKTEIELAEFVGEKIKYYRKSKNLTQKQLGQKIGKSDNTISNYEKGIAAPSQDALFSLAAALDIKVDDLFPKRNNVDTLHNALETTNENFDLNDIHFLKKLMEYIETLSDDKRKQLLGNIELAVQLFKNQN